MHYRSPILALVGAASFGVASFSSLQAQDTIFQIGADQSLWGVSGSWQGGNIPTFAQIAGINANSGGAGVSGGTIVVGANADIGSVTFSGSTRKIITIDNAVNLNLYGTGSGEKKLIDLSGNQHFSISGAGSLNLQTSGIFNVSNATRSLSITSRIVETGGSRQIIKTGDGTLTLNNLVTATSTFSGGILVRQGSLSSNVSSTVTGNVITQGPFGTGDLIFNDGTSLIYTHLTQAGTYHNRVRLNGNVTFGNAGPQRMILAGDMLLEAAQRTITVGQEVEISGAISNGALRKAGTSTLILSGTNSYTGATTIAAGTLALSGSGTIASSSDIAIDTDGIFEVRNGYQLAANQTLSGDGIVKGTLRLGSGLVRPGGTTNRTLTVDGNAVFGGGALAFDLALGENDQLRFIGNNYTLTGNDTGAVKIQLSDLSGSVDAGRYLLISTSDMTNVTYNDWGLSTFSIDGGLAGWNTSLYWEAGDLYVDVAAIPEAQTWGMLLIGSGLFFLVRRKKIHAV